MKKDKLSKEKYIKKINKYFNGSKLLTEIFLNKNLFQNFSTFNRENIYFYIEKNYEKKLQEYPLYIDKTNVNFNSVKYKANNNNENINTEQNDNNDNTLILMNNSSKENSNTSLNSVNIPIIKNQQYDSLEPEFRNIEKKNDGIFPISLFEDMLKEININARLIEIIGGYLKKKTKKSFFNFDLFKEVLSLLIYEETNPKKVFKDICNGIFTLISYPKNFIDKKSLLALFQNERTIEKKLEKLEINKHIELNQFIELYKSINDIFSESLEHIKYLKFIFFKEKIEDDLSIENKCVRILLKDKSMADYILERLQYDTNFYLIDRDFWNKWNELTCSDNIIDINNKDLRKLRINTKSFSDNQGKILEGKKFPDNYVILSRTIFNLFIEWYGPPLGLTIMRSKIYLEDDSNNINRLKKKIKKEEECIFSGIEEKTNKKFELELNPIYLEFYYYMSLFQSSNNSREIMKRKLRNIYKEEGGNSNSFSRKTKFSEIAKRLNHNMNINNIRFIVYCNYTFDYADMNESLEEFGIRNKALILIDEKINNVWASEKNKKEDRNQEPDENEENLVGLYNIGNTCYMNSILQIFLNIEEIKNIFIKQNEEKKKTFLSFILNLENKEIINVVNKKGFLVLELIHLLKEKWELEKKVITPRRFKEICGEYNPMFKTSEQQDAHDFYTFLVDKLHEETNIKYRNDNSYNDILNSETIDTNEIDLGNECWANNIRKNASYFYALFMGQLKSTLICSECNTQKIKFEAFSSLEIPIPEGNNIIIDIILFRLPYSLRKFNLKKLNDEEDAKDITSSTMESINVKKKNKKNKKDKNEKFNRNLDENDNTLNAEKNTEENEVINNLLNLNIPLRLKIEISRKEKCSSIIDKLKCMSDLNIEKNYYFTEFIMISKGKFINGDLLIDETFSNLNVVFIYELLNYKGIINIFDYEEKQKLQILSLKSQGAKYNENNDKSIKKISTISKNKNLKEINFNLSKNLNIPLFYFTIKQDKNKKNDYETYEILVPIIHRIKSEILKNFIPVYNYQYFYNFQDFIILSSSNSIKPYNLYEMMWKKYSYFLNSPSNFDNKTWWKLKKKDKKYLPIPFEIKIINKDTSACAICPWFRFCTGCTIDPIQSEYLDINSNCLIAVEWDNEIYNKEINKNNLTLIMNHNSFSKIGDVTKNINDKISIDDCLKLFGESEEINDIQCEKCKKKTLFKKTLEIERLPKYLVLVLKRFKYILTNTIKITKLINFPIEELSLQNYVSQKNINYKYSLFGVINHIGSLEGGHYYSSFNLNNKFIEFDDSQVHEVRGGIETNKVYMLIYESKKTERKDKNLNLMGLMDRAYQIYLHHFKFKHIFNYIYDENKKITKEYANNCEFYYGEPVTIDGKYGFIVNITKEEEKDSNIVDIKIKLRKGFFTGKINVNKIIKETYKKYENTNIDSFLNEEKENKKNIGKEEVVCGSQVCLIY